MAESYLVTGRRHVANGDSNCSHDPAQQRVRDATAQWTAAKEIRIYRRDFLTENDGVVVKTPNSASNWDMRGTGCSSGKYGDEDHIVLGRVALIGRDHQCGTRLMGNARPFRT